MATTHSALEVPPWYLEGKSPTGRHCYIFIFTGFFQTAPFPPTAPAPNAFKLLILSHRNIQSKKSILLESYNFLKIAYLHTSNT